MRKKILLLGTTMSFLSLGAVFATAKTTDTWVSRGSTPEEIASTIADKANEDLKIQDTKLNKITNDGSYGKKYPITNTLEWIRKNIQPYLQRILYIGLVGATILLIRNGFLLVTKSAGMKGGDIKTVQGNIKTILLGVLIMTSFRAIIKIVMAVMNMLFSS